MTLLKPTELEVFLRQCLICFGHGRVLYVGGHTVDAMRFLLNQGADAHALTVTREEADRVAPQFVAARVKALQSGASLAEAFPGAKFDAVIVVESDGVAAQAARLFDVRKEGQAFTQLAVLTPANTGAARESSAQACLDRLRAAGWRRHARSRTAIFQSPPLPDAVHKSWFFEVLPEPALATDTRSFDILRKFDADSVAAQSCVTELCDYIRIGDTVAVLDGSGGSAARIIEQNSAARHVSALAFDSSHLQYALANYASDGQITLSLEADADVSNEALDVVVAMDFHRAPLVLMRGLLERLRPGGRAILCLPQGSSSQSDDSTAREWLRDISEQCGGRLIAEKAWRVAHVLENEGARALRAADLDASMQRGAGALIVIAMIDPLAASSMPYVETTFETVQSDAFAVVPDEVGMLKPWLFKSMISIGMRLTNTEALADLNERVLVSLQAESADFGAALCGKAYRILGSSPTASEALACIAQIDAWIGSVPAPTPQQLRWSISLAFVAAKLAQSVGDLELCEAWASRCAALDPMPFSPLLGTKVVGALDIASSLALARGDLDAARERLVRAVQTVRRLLSGDWINIVGNEEKPLSFGLPEAAQLVDAGARCAYLLNYLKDATYRPGLVWSEHRSYYERIIDASRRSSETVQSYASMLVREIGRLEGVITAKHGETQRLEGVIAEKEAERLRLESVVAEKEARCVQLEVALLGKDAERYRLASEYADKEVVRLQLESKLAEKDSARLRCEGLFAGKEAELLRLEEALRLKERQRAGLEALLAAERATARARDAWQRMAREKRMIWRAAGLVLRHGGRVKRLLSVLKRGVRGGAMAHSAAVGADQSATLLSVDRQDVHQPVAPVRFDDAAGTWLSQFPTTESAGLAISDSAATALGIQGEAREPNVQMKQGLRLVAAAELTSLQQAEGEVIVGLFGADDDVYAARAQVYDKVDLCVATDHQTHSRLSLLHPLVIEAQGASAIATIERFGSALARQKQLRVEAPFNEVTGSPAVMLQVDNFMVGGLERVVFDLLQHLSDRGFRPMLGVTGEIAPEARAELDARRFSCVHLPQEPGALRAVLVDNQVSLVNAHYSLSLASACAELAIPFIQTVHNMYMWLDAANKAKWRDADSSTDAYICVSANVAMFADVNLRLATERMLVIPNGVDAASGVPLATPERDEALRAELGLPAGSPVFVNVASINPVKGQGLLIDAFARAHAQRPDIRLVILGKHADAGYAQRLREKIDSYGLQDAVLMPGYRADVHRFVDLARAVVMPSFTEGWSLAISEALQRRAPVIATDVGGAHEQLVDPSSTVIRSWRDDWTTLDGAEFYHAIANEGELRAVCDELSAALIEHADRAPRAASGELHQTFTAMTPAQAYERHVEVFAAVLARRSATPVRYASYRPQRQSRYVDTDSSGA